MPGRVVSLIWASDPTLDAPPRYRRACRYEAYVPGSLAELALQSDAEVAGVVSEAEHAIRDLNADARPALAPLARLLLRTESIASSKVEGMHAIYQGLEQLQAVGVLVPASSGRRNQMWEADGLFELLEALEAGTNG